MERVISLLGIIVFLGLGYLFSLNRKAVQWRTVLWGMALQFILAVFILKTPLGLALFQFLGSLVGTFLNFSDVGAEFVFGEGFEEHFIAFKVLPTIIFFSSFISLLYHYNILPKIVKAIAFFMIRTMKTSGPESLNAAANIFVGQTEGPLIIKPYIKNLTMSELHAVMTGGFATIAGGVMAAYISFGISAEHLISASVMSAPAALAISKLFYPETEKLSTVQELEVEDKTPYVNAIDAIAAGALDGLKLALNVGAMLIAFISLLAVVNSLFGWVGVKIGLPDLSLEWFLAYIMAPFAWLMGVPWSDCLQVGILLGKRTILNEFVAYLELQELITQQQISPRAIVITTYALCGFANIGSIAIQIGGISAIAPSRQPDLAKLGVRAMLAGTIACFITACIAGMLI